jgi:hypothetical protein
MKIDLIKLIKAGSSTPHRQPQIDQQFWALIEAAGFNRWRVGDAICRTPRRLLIGLASYSIRDVELAQAIISRPLSERTSLVIEFFNVLDVVNMEGFQQYIPGIEPIYQTPVIGIWEDGILVRSAQGTAAVQAIKDLLFE